MTSIYMNNNENPLGDRKIVGTADAREDSSRKRGRRKGFEMCRKLLEHRGYEILRDRHNIILRPVNSFRQAQYFSTLGGALRELFTKLLLERISEGEKKDIQNILSSLRGVRSEFTNLLESRRGSGK